MTDLVFRVLLKADGSGLIGQTRLSREEVGKLKPALEQAAGGAEKLAGSTKNAAKSAEELERKAAALKGKLDPAWAAQEKMNAALVEAKTLFDAGYISAEKYARAQALITGATTNGAKAAGQHRQAYTQLGFQIQDISQTLALGINPLVVLAQQGGQTASAIQQMGGRFAGVAGFIAGPWGSIILAGAVVLGGLAQRFFETADASKEAEAGLQKFADRQADIGKFIDATTGRLIEQNKTLLQNAVLSRQAQIDKNKLAIQGQRAVVNAAIDTVAITGSEFRAERQAGAPTFDPAILKVVTAARGDVEKLDQGLQALAKRRPDLAGVVKTVSDAAAQAVLLSQENRKLGLEIDTLSGKTVAQTKVTASMIEKQVALTTATTPLEKARAKLSLITDQGAAAEKAGGIALDQYRARLTEAQVAVNAAEQAVKNVSAGRREHNKELREEAKAAREAAAASRELDRTYDQLLKKLDPLASAMKDYREQLEGISALRIAGRINFGESILLDISADRERQEAVTQQWRDAAKNVFGPDFDQGMKDWLAAADNGRDAAADMAETLRTDGVDAMRKMADMLGGAAGEFLQGLTGSGPLSGMLKGLIDPASFAEGSNNVTGGQKALLDKIGGIFDPNGGPFSKGLSKALGQAGAGAATGAQIASLGKALGLKTSKLGGEIGGAVGSFLPIPGGEIIGSIVGSLLGGALKKTKKASATLSLGDDGLTSTVTGNSKSRRVASTAAADSVIGALQSIADQFGGSITGDPSVSIGVRDKNFRVDPTGQGKTKKKNGAVDFGDDQAGAIAFATADAIKDGVISGLSPAILKALQSSDDLDKAVREALKVDNIETLLGGVTAELGKVFKDFERQAAERLRIAKKYGFDLVELEKVTGKERADLFEKTLESRIGSLQSLLSDLAFGDLFEGSAKDRRAALQSQIITAQGQADSGVDGAAETLAKLQRDMLALTREAFGTAGPEFSSDRAAAIASAQRVIDLETQRAAAAQDAARAALAAAQKTAELANENNSQNAQIISQNEQIIAALRDRTGLYQLTLAATARATPL